MDSSPKHKHSSKIFSNVANVWWTTTSASRQPRRRRPPRTPLRLHRRLKGHLRTHLHHTSPGWSPVCQCRLCPVSGPLHASRRLPAASRPSLASPGAAPEAANEAVALHPPREAPAAVRGPPAAQAAEPPFCMCSSHLSSLLL